MDNTVLCKSSGNVCVVQLSFKISQSIFSSSSFILSKSAHRKSKELKWSSGNSLEFLLLVHLLELGFRIMSGITMETKLWSDNVVGVTSISLMVSDSLLVRTMSRMLAVSPLAVLVGLSTTCVRRKDSTSCSRVLAQTVHPCEFDLIERVSQLMLGKLKSPVMKTV